MGHGIALSRLFFFLIKGFLEDVMPEQRPEGDKDHDAVCRENSWHTGCQWRETMVVGCYAGR